LGVLEAELPVSEADLDEAERQLLAGQQFLSEKPLIVAVNLDEALLSAGDYPQRDQVMEYAGRSGILVIEICARVEMEIGRLSPGEREEFMAELGFEEPGLARLARAAYERLGLLSFFTVGDDEVRAWTIRRGMAAR
jgi:ribosome-binding ATPase YchF (GTP1/OBG family)